MRNARHKPMGIDRRANARPAPSRGKDRAWHGTLLLPAVVVLATGTVLGAHAAVEGGDTAASAPPRPAPHQRGKGASLDDRVRMLAKALDLDARQQTEVKAVLQAQRDETLKVWADESLPAALRVKATEVIGERTADRIRALLNDEQKKKYSAPRLVPEHPAERPHVERWMKPA
jgi:Spy/CpxP family protein refolding chaperone